MLRNYCAIVFNLIFAISSHRSKISNKKNEETRNEDNEIVCYFVLIELRASFKLALSIKDYKVALDAYWILIFAALFWRENFLN